MVFNFTYGIQMFGKCTTFNSYEDFVPLGHDDASPGNRFTKFRTNLVPSSAEVHSFDITTTLPSKSRKSITQWRSVISHMNGISNQTAVWTSTVTNLSACSICFLAGKVFNSSHKTHWLLSWWWKVYSLRGTNCIFKYHSRWFQSAIKLWFPKAKGGFTSLGGLNAAQPLRSIRTDGHEYWSFSTHRHVATTFPFFKIYTETSLLFSALLKDVKSRFTVKVHDSEFADPLTRASAEYERVIIIIIIIIMFLKG